MNGIINSLGSVLKDTDVDLSLDNILGVALREDSSVDTANMTFLPNRYCAVAFASKFGTTTDVNLAKKFIIKKFLITNESEGTSQEIFTINTQTDVSYEQYHLTHSNSIARSFYCTYQTSSTGRVYNRPFCVIFLKS